MPILLRYSTLYPTKDNFITHLYYFLLILDHFQCLFCKPLVLVNTRVTSSSSHHDLYMLSVSGPVVMQPGVSVLVVPQHVVSSVPCPNIRWLIVSQSISRLSYAIFELHMYCTIQNSAGDNFGEFDKSTLIYQDILAN